MRKHSIATARSPFHWRCRLAVSRRTTSGRRWRCPTGWSSVAGVGVAQQNPTTPFWQDLGSAELNRLIDNALGAESRSRSSAASHRAGARPGQSRRRAALSDDQRQRLGVAHVSRSAGQYQVGARRRQHQLRSRSVGQESQSRQSPPTIASTPASSIAKRCA